MSENKAKQLSVNAFEQSVSGKKRTKALKELQAILEKISGNMGGIDGIECTFPEQLKNMPQEIIVHFCTGMAHAITELFLDPKLEIPQDGFVGLMNQQRWINMIFASSPYINADHILRAYNDGKNGEDAISIPSNLNAFAKFCLLCLLESNITPDLDALWSIDPVLCTYLCFGLQSPRFIGTEVAFNKRNHILQWFPDHLEQIQTLNGLSANIAHDVYMHCSYDIAPNKHDVKRPLNHVIRRFILQNGLQDRDVSEIGLVNGKPVMVVLLEHFNAGHSIYTGHIPPQ